MEDMRFFYAKIGQSNGLASDFLIGKSPINEPAVPIFLNQKPSTREDFEKFGEAKEQGRNFFWCSDHPEHSRIVVLNDGNLVIVKPIKPAVFWKANKPLGYANAGDHIKLLPVTVVNKSPLAGVPGVLTSISANAYYYTGTFREISDYGNILALKSLLGIPREEIDSASDLLYCLGSIELETLVAKVFEESGCFVPAYRGGAVKGVDIFAKNLSDMPVSLGSLSIDPRKSVSVQVKRRTQMTKPPQGCDFLVSAEHDAKWLLSLVAGLPITRSWLKTSLEWVGTRDIAKFGL